MKFNVEKFKSLSRTMTAEEQREIEEREENRDWLALSAKFALVTRNILRSKNLTQTELAHRMGVSCAQVTKLLSGKENVGLQTIAKVEKALDCRVVVFLDSNCDDSADSLTPQYSQNYFEGDEIPTIDMSVAESDSNY